MQSFEGGLNLRDAPGELAPNESPDMMNVTLDERGGVVKRLGFQRDNSGPIYQADTAAPSVLSGNEITDTIRSTGAEGDGWPYLPYTFFDARSEGSVVSATTTEPWTGWEGLSGQVANQLFLGTTSPTPRQGSKWTKFVVRPGDKFGVTTGERSEYLATPSIEADGQEHWYAWSTQFPVGFVRPSGWCIFTQLHSDTRFGQAAFKFQIDQTAGVNYMSLVLTCGPFADGAQALSPIESNNLRFSNFAQLALGVWHDIIMRVRFSSTGKGMVQLWHRQEGEVSFTQVANQDDIYTVPTITGDPTPGAIFLKQGLYRNDEASLTTTVFHDGFARGNTFEELSYTYAPTAAMGSVGIWPASTNLHPNGGAETNTTGWTAQSGSTLTRDTVEHKFGVASLKCVTDSTQSSSSAARSESLTNGTKYTWGAWIKGTSGTRCRIYAVDSTSANLGQTPFTCNGDWMYMSVTFTATANNNHSLRIGQTTTGTTLTYFIDGAMLEAHATATPYKHTDGGTATRNAARVQYAASGIDVTQGFVAAELRMGWNSASGLGNGTGTPRLFDWTLDANNYLRCYYSEANQEWVLERKAAGTGSTVAFPNEFVRRQRVVVAAAWTATTLRLSVNGFPFVESANMNIPSGLPVNFDFGSSAGTAQHIGADKKWLSFGTGTLDDEDARTLGEAYANPFAIVTPTNLYYCEAFGQLILQLGTKLFKRVATGSYTEITRTGPVDAFTVAKVVGFAELPPSVGAATALYVIHPDDGVLKYTGTGFISVVNSTAKGNALATWQNKLWGTGVNSTVWWSNAGAGDTWTTATDFVQIRDVNDDVCTAIGFGQSLDSGAVPESGLLVFKRNSLHRIIDSASGEYKTLSAEAGAAGTKAVAHLSGLTMCVNDKGVWLTDGENTPVLTSARVQPFFTPASLAMNRLANIAAGVHRDRFVISFTRSGRTNNDLTLEYHPELGWFAPHEFGMQAYAVHKLADASLYGLTTSDVISLARLFTGGTDDQLANGTPGEPLSCRFRTRWIEPVNGGLTRLRRVRLQHRGAFDFYQFHDFAETAGELVLVTETEAAGAAIYGVSIWGQATYGPDETAREHYSDVYSLGAAKAWSFELRQEGSEAVLLPQLLQTGVAPEAGQVALYELHIDFVPLGYA
jgi:hypothetical protein